MKKLLTILFVFLSVFMLLGCAKKKEEYKDPKQEEEKDDKILVDGVEFKFETEKKFQNLSYKMDDKLKETNPYTDPKAAPIRQHLYKASETDSSYKIVIRMFYYKTKTLEQAMKDLGIEEDASSLFTVETEHMSLKMHDQKQTEGTGHIYFINDNSDYYAVQIGSRSDIKKFENAFLKTFELKG